VGIANARVAYARFEERFAGERWERLAAGGAAVQRPLWASTATKDPAYRDVVYLEQLALPGSILTVPEPTLHAFADHGDPGLAEPLDRHAAERALGAVDIAAIAYELEREGVEAFRDSYRQLLEAISVRSRRGRGSQAGAGADGGRRLPAGGAGSRGGATTAA
jgi:transaldolase